MATSALSQLRPTQEEISARAYEIYLREGSVPGRDLDNWLRAEAELRAGQSQSNGSSGNGAAHSNGSQPSAEGQTIIASTKTASVVEPATTSARQTTPPRRGNKRDREPVGVR